MLSSGMIYLARPLYLQPGQSFCSVICGSSPFKACGSLSFCSAMSQKDQRSLRPCCIVLGTSKLCSAKCARARECVVLLGPGIISSASGASAKQRFLTVIGHNILLGKWPLASYRSSEDHPRSPRAGRAASRANWTPANDKPNPLSSAEWPPAF